MNLNKKQKELLMYCVLAFVGGYLMCMYYPVHRRTNGVNFQLPPVVEGLDSNGGNSNGENANPNPNGGNANPNPNANPNANPNPNGGNANANPNPNPNGGNANGR